MSILLDREERANIQLVILAFIVLSGIASAATDNTYYLENNATNQSVGADGFTNWSASGTETSITPYINLLKNGTMGIQVNVTYIVPDINTEYEVFRFYLSSNYTVNTQISENINANIGWRASSSTDTVNVSLIDYNPADSTKTVIGNRTFTTTGGTSLKYYSIAIPNSQYIVPAGNRLMLRINTTSNTTGQVGLYFNDTRSNITINETKAIGRDAWNYAGDSIPVPTNYSWIPATSDNMSAISSINSDRWETKLTTDHNQSDYQMYRFHVTQPVINITNLTVTWTGYGEARIGYNISLYIWNIYTGSWEQLGTKYLTADGALSGSKMSNISNYIDGMGYVYIAAGARHYNYAPPVPTGLSASPGNTDVTISWSPAVDQDGDAVQYYVDIVGGYGSSTCGRTWINATSCYFYSLNPGNTYTYRVKARDTFANTESAFVTGSFDIKASCPFVYGWNGSDYVYLTDLEGQVIGAPFFKVENYRAGLYDLGALNSDNGIYKIKVRETLAEADYFDEAKLWIVDVPRGYNVYTDWHDVYIPGLPVTYNLYTIKNPKKPVSAYDKFGTDVLRNLEEIDDYPVAETLNDTNYYTLDFGKVEHPEHAKLIVYGWNAFLKRKGDIDPYKNITSYHEQNTIIEVVNSRGEWQKVREFGRLAGDLKPTVFNISGIWLTDDHRIRIHPAYSKFAVMVLDKIELDDSEPVPVEVKILNLTYADLHHGGSDSYIYPDLKHRLHAQDIEKTDFKDSYFYGNFTKYGDVLPLLTEPDDMYVIMRHGDELELEFPAIDKKEDSERKLFLYADVYYSIKKTVDETFLRDTLEPLPFHGMSKYPYDTSIENYPYDQRHLDYLKKWNTRVCEKGKDDCYDLKIGKEINNQSETLEDFLYRYGFPKKSEEILPRSLNSNYIELKINNQVIGNTISNLRNSDPTSTGSFILWDNDVDSDNRVYYGLNEADVNNLVNGNWSTWDNDTIDVNIRLSGLAENTTYYYKPQSWYFGAASTVPAKAFTTLKPGVWVSPSEYMISPAGWISSPVNFRTVNIFAAPLDNTGHYAKNLSLEAVIYTSTGSEIGRINLNGSGPYSGSFTLSDNMGGEMYIIRITDYPIAGEFNVLRWGCANCHVNNYPSTFSPGTVHPKHIDPTYVHTFHPDPYSDTGEGWYVNYTTQCGYGPNSCHSLFGPPTWATHPRNDSCSSCHLSQSLICENCHNNISTSDNFLSPRYGKDKHSSQACGNCHGNLTSLNTKPSCPTCHPRPGSNLSGFQIPGSIKNQTHPPAQNVSCGICHNTEHDIRSFSITACSDCHSSYNRHNGTVQCTQCHTGDIHAIKFFNATGGNTTDKAQAGNCTTCHQKTVMDGRITYPRVPPKIPDPVLHSNDASAGRKWNTTPGYWINGTYSTAQLSSCKYCHGSTTHNISALGRSTNWRGNNTVNSSLSRGNWCASCHSQDYISGTNTYNDMINTFTVDSLLIPPEISGNDTYGANQSIYEYINHSRYTKNDSTCNRCHGYGYGYTTITQLMHSQSRVGGANCVGCHDTGGIALQAHVDVAAANDTSAIHKNLNNGASASNSSAYYSNNKRCWACHGNGSEPSPNAHPANYKTPYRCPDCHIPSETQNFNFTPSYVPNVTQHYWNGSSIKTPNVSVCYACHNKSEMLIPANDPDTGSGAVYGGANGGNNSTSHYGRKRPDLRTGISTNCSYCHQNSSTVFAAAMVDPSYNSSISNHSSNYSSNPGCTAPQCHNAGWIHNSTLIRPNLTLPNSSFCLNCHGDNGSGNPNYTDAVTGIKARHNNTLNCTQCHLNTSMGIHPVRYLQQDLTWDISRTNAVNCVTCHQGTGLDGFDSAPKVPSPMAHSENRHNGSIWNGTQPGYWTGNQTGMCNYCHGDSKHNAAALGRPANWMGNNTVNSSISNYSNWCSGCHYQGYSSNGKNYGDMTGTFVSASLPVPPEISNYTPYAPYNVSGYFNHSLSPDYNDTTCKDCHGKFLPDGAAIKDFVHNVSTGICTGCHFSYDYMKSQGAPSRYVNQSMFSSSPHGSVACQSCHTKGHNSIGARKACEDCHAYQKDPINDRDRHNITARPSSYIYNGMSVVDITDCILCHDPAIYNNAIQIYGKYKSPAPDCDYCHTYPDKMYS